MSVLRMDVDPPKAELDPALMGCGKHFLRLPQSTYISLP
jgi:hypothetical protein